MSGSRKRGPGPVRPSPAVDDPNLPADTRWFPEQDTRFSQLAGAEPGPAMHCLHPLPAPFRESPDLPELTMPELPEVETMVRGVRPLVAGRRLVRLRSCRNRCRPLSISPSLRAIAARLRDRRVLGVRRRGKRILMEFDTGAILAVEPRMTGLMLAADPPDRSHLRLEWMFARPDGSPNAGGATGDPKTDSIWFWDRRGLGTVRLYTPDEYTRVVESGRLGPDALALSTADWQALLQTTARPVKIVLLDQKRVAGIGNLYASEILHLARIDPRQPASALTAAEAARVAACVRTVLEDAIRDEGSTLSDATYRTVLSEPGRYQNRHQVYARAGELCLNCGETAVERIVQQQRSTFFCPSCQSGNRPVAARRKRRRGK